MTEDEAREIVGSWLSRDWVDKEHFKRYNLTPVLEQIAAIDAYLDAEAQRIADEDDDVLSAEQARVDALPRRRYKLTYDVGENTEHWAIHRVPIDCWSARSYGDGTPGVYLAAPESVRGWRSVRHGDLFDIVRHSDGVEPKITVPSVWPDGRTVHLPVMQCECIKAAIVECTDEWAAGHSDGRTTLEPIDAQPGQSAQVDE